MARELPPYVRKTIDEMREKQREQTARDAAMRHVFQRQVAEEMFTRACVAEGVDPAGGISPSLMRTLGVDPMRNNGGSE